jgi:hypothetical protein
MQVNSAQDYLTQYKRRVQSALYYTTPPEQKDKTNSLWLSTVGNNASTRVRKDTPVIGAWGGVPAGPTYTNSCSNCSTATGAPGTFQTVNTKDVLSIQALRPIGVRATSVIT